VLTTEHRVADRESRPPEGGSQRLGANSTWVLCGLWVLVIVLAVAIDLAK